MIRATQRNELDHSMARKRNTQAAQMRSTLRNNCALIDFLKSKMLCVPCSVVKYCMVEHMKKQTPLPQISSQIVWRQLKYTALNVIVVIPKAMKANTIMKMAPVRGISQLRLYVMSSKPIPNLFLYSCSFGFSMQFCLIALAASFITISSSSQSLIFP